LHKCTEVSERLRIAALLLVLSLAVGCTERGMEGSATSMGPEWQAHLETRIGSLDDPDQSLNTVGQVMLGPEGELFISQPRDAEVRVYDVEGNLVRKIGRRGEGPGEFAQIGYTGLSGDTLYVTEAGRISFFSLGGDFLGSRALTTETVRGAQMSYAPFAPQMFILLSDGTALVKPGFFSSASPPSDAPGVRESQMRIPFYRTDSVSAVLDTVAWEELGGRSVGVMRGGRLFRLIPPFDESPLVAPALDGTGLVVVDRGTDTITREAGFLVFGLNPDGDTLFSRRIPYEPLSVDGEYLREHVRQTQVVPRDQPGGPDSDAVEGDLRSAGVLPSVRVPVRALFVGQDGSIWLQRGDQGSESAVWQVLARDGEVAGVVRLPRNAQVVAASGETVATLELDEFDVPYVARYQLDRGL
jgi:hypothetical protein